MRVPTTVGIVGVGSIGGFLCKEMLDRKNIEKVVVIDFDTIDESNLTNSIYNSPFCINRKKTTCLKDIFSDNRISIIDKKYEDIDYDKLKDLDAIIDCRDIISDKGFRVNLRISTIEGYIALFDFRREPPINSSYIGGYWNMLHITDLIRIANIASNLVMTRYFKTFCNLERIYTLQFDSIEKDLSKLKKRIKELDYGIEYNEEDIAMNLGLKQIKEEHLFFQKHHEDRIYEYHNLEEKIYGVTNIKPIFLENQERDIEIYGPNQNLSTPVRISRGFFKSEDDVRNKLRTILGDTLQQSNYDLIVSITPSEELLVIQLLNVTKGA